MAPSNKPQVGVSISSWAVPRPAPQLQNLLCAALVPRGGDQVVAPQQGCHHLDLLLCPHSPSLCPSAPALGEAGPDKLRAAWHLVCGGAGAWSLLGTACYTSTKCPRAADTACGSAPAGHGVCRGRELPITPCRRFAGQERDWFLQSQLCCAPPSADTLLDRQRTCRVFGEGNKTPYGVSIWAERLPGRKDSQVRRALDQGERKLSRLQPSPRYSSAPHPSTPAATVPAGVPDTVPCVGKRGWEPGAWWAGTTPQICSPGIAGSQEKDQAEK